MDSQTIKSMNKVGACVSSRTLETLFLTVLKIQTEIDRRQRRRCRWPRQPARCARVEEPSADVTLKRVENADVVGRDLAMREEDDGRRAWSASQTLNAESACITTLGRSLTQVDRIHRPRDAGIGVSSHP